MYSVTLNSTRSSVGRLFVPQSDITSPHSCNSNELIWKLSVEQMTSLNMVHEIPRCHVTFRVVKKEFHFFPYLTIVSTTQIARFMGPTWGPSGADRSLVGPMLTPWTFLSGYLSSMGQRARVHACYCAVTAPWRLKLPATRSFNIQQLTQD